MPSAHDRPDEQRASDGSATDWDAAPLTRVIDHILERYHAPLRADLSALIPLAASVEQAHRDEPSCPRGLADHLVAMQEAVEDHLQKEERILFPLIGIGRGAQAQMPIRVMLEEHVDHGESLVRMRALAHDLVPPAGAGSSWHALYRGLAALEVDLRAHIALENLVLFPRALRG